jgi:hypothetical protein
MTIFKYLASKDKTGFNALRKVFQAEQRKLPRHFTEVAQQNLSNLNPSSARAPLRAWRSRDFLAQLWEDEIPGGEVVWRLAIHRCKIENNGDFSDKITWDELMEVKAGIGLDDFWAVEVFPPSEHVVNVANMRHLFICKGRPCFAWKATDSVECSCDGAARCLYCETQD